MSQNVIYIGNKPPMNYVLALIGAFGGANVENVVLKARGQAISKAVDVAEIARRRFLTDIKVSEIEIGTEQMPIQEGGTHGVSIISITMEKTKQTKPEKTPSTKPLDLSEIKGVGAARAEKLREAGFKTVESVAKAKAEKLSKLTGISEKLSASIIESAKELEKG
jgi:DNA-binding protein